MGQERYLTQTVVSTAGAALKWFRNTITPNMQYDGICQLAASVPPGAGGVAEGKKKRMDVLQG